MVDVVKSTIATYEKIAEKWANKYQSTGLAEDELKYFIKNLKGKKVLDVGCGPGRDSQYFYDHGLEPIGIDMTKSF